MSRFYPPIACLDRWRYSFESSIPGVVRLFSQGRLVTVVCFFVAFLIATHSDICSGPVVSGQEPTAPVADVASEPVDPAKVAEQAREQAIIQAEIPEKLPVPSEKPAEAAAIAQQVETALADPKEAQPEEPPVVALLKFDPKKSFSQLLYPHVAERVGLTEEQVQQVNRIMVARSAKLASVDKSKWNDIVVESEIELKSLLTPAQLERFVQTQVEKKIALRFSKENWGDVLKWFAAEIGLQLVMDAPPPGSFSYNDKNSYTPKEALDIINGAIQFRGYTLIRFGEMLLLHNFKNGQIPLQYVPKISLEDLPNQGRFDYVALTIPLEARSIEAVQTVIKPFQGPNSYTRVMPGNTLMVVDSTAVLRQVAAAALAVHNPVPAPAKPPRASDVPVWQSYELKNTSPAVVRDQVAVFAPDAKPLLNPASKTISFLASPSLQTVIAGLIERLENGGDISRDATVVVYSLESVFSSTPLERLRMARRFDTFQTDYISRLSASDLGTELKEGIEKIVPDAKISINIAAKKMIVLASTGDQERIGEIIDNLFQGPDAQDSIVLRVYSFEKSKVTLNATLEQAIRGLAPSAQVVPDTVNRLVLVVASSKEHEQIEKAVLEIEGTLLKGEEDDTLAIYPMTGTQRKRFGQIFAQIASTPDMVGAVTIQDGVRNQLCVWAKPRQQEQIKGVVEQIVGAHQHEWEAKLGQNAVPSPLPATTDGKTRYQLFDEDILPVEESEIPIEPITVQAADSIVAQPEESVEPTTIPQEAVEPIATPAEPVVTGEIQPTVKDLLGDTPTLSQLPGAPEGVFLSVLRLNKALPSVADELIVNTVPGIEVSIDPASRSLILCGTRTMISAAMDIIKELELGQQVTYRIVTLSPDFPTETLSALSLVEPAVGSGLDRRYFRLYLYGRTADVTRAEKFVQGLIDSVPTEERTISYLEVNRDLPLSTLDYIRRVLPMSEISYDAVNRQFTIFGSETEQLYIARLITDAEQNLPLEQETRFYTFERRVPDRVIRLLNELVPGLTEVKRDETNPTILQIRCKPGLFVKVESTLSSLKTEYPQEEYNELLVYEVADEVKGRFMELRGEFEKENGAVRTIGNLPDQILVWGLPKQHEELRTLLDKLGQVPKKRKELPYIHRINQVDANTILTVLRNIYPELTITNDTVNNQLIIPVDGEDLEDVKRLLAQMETIDPNEPKRFFVPYSVRNFYLYNSNGTVTNRMSLANDMERLVPGARVGYDYYSQQIIVWGTEEEQSRISAALEKVDGKVDLESAIIRYSIRSATPSTLINTISELFPRVTPTYEPNTGMLIFRLPNADPTVAAEIQQILVVLDQEQAPSLKCYPLTAPPSDALIDALRQLVPRVPLLKGDSQGKQLIVIAPPAQHEIIDTNLAAVIDSFGAAAQKMIPYPIYGIEPATLQTTLTRIYPNTKIELDTKGKRLLIWANLDDHVQISEEISQVNSTGRIGDSQSDLGTQVKVYTFPDYASSSQFKEIVQTLLPVAEIFTDPYSYYTMNYPQKITVVAPAPSQRRVEMLYEQTKNVESANRYTLSNYPFGDADATTVESLISGILPDSESLSPPSVQTNTILPPSYIVARRNRNYNRSYYTNTVEPQPFYRVDPNSQTVAVFAKTEDQVRVRQAVESIAALGETESKLVSKVYVLSSPIAYTIASAVRQMVPGGAVIPTGQNELIVYAIPGNLEKVDEMLKGVEEGDLTGGMYQMRMVIIPEGSLYPRTSVVGWLSSAFLSRGGHVYAGSHANQLILWGTKPILDEMEKYLNETFKVTEQESYKTYPLEYLSPAMAQTLLTRMCPNATYDPNPTQRTLTVFATVFVHEQIANALKTLDQPRDQENELIVRHYNMNEGSPSTFYPIYNLLLAHFPSFPIVADYPAGQLIITAAESEHVKVARCLEDIVKTQDLRKPTLQSYYLAMLNPANLFPILNDATPRARVFVGKTPNELYVWGTVAEQDRVRDILSKMESVAGEEDEDRFCAKIYNLNARAASIATIIINYALPGGSAIPLADNRVIVWGSPADHKRAEELLGVFAESFPASITRQYATKVIRPADVINWLSMRFYPDAVFAISQDGDSLYVFGPESIQEKIAVALDSLDADPPEEMQRQPVAYDLSDIPTAYHSSVISTLRTIVPDSTFLPTVSTGYFIVYAKEPAQAKIAKLVEEILKEQGWLKGRMETYSLRKMSYVQAITLLQPIAPNARFGIGVEPNQLLVFGKDADQQRIKEALDNLNAEEVDPLVLQIYHLEYAQLYSSLLAINALYPQITGYIDPTARTLSIKATATDHEKIAKYIKELDRVDDDKQVNLQVFNLGNIDYSRISTALLNFYNNDPAFRVQYDTSFKSLIVQGTANQRKTVAELVEKIKDGALMSDDVTLKTYTPKSYVSSYMLRSFFREQGKDILIMPDYYTGKLIVFGNESEHKVISGILETMAPEATMLAIFDLKMIEPGTAQYIISNMLETDGSYLDVNFDPMTNQIYIRGTKEKLEEIRRILIMMGEKDLQKIPAFTDAKVPVFNAELAPGTTATVVPTAIAPTTPATPLVDPATTVENTGSGLIRTIRPTGDAKAILNEVQRQWNRKNPLQVIQSDDSEIIQTKENPTGVIN